MNVLFLGIGAAFFAACAVLFLNRSVTTGSPLDSSFLIVLGILFAAGVSLLAASLTFPYRVTLSETVLEIKCAYGRKTIPVDRIKSIEWRDGISARNVCVVQFDGTVIPLGIWSKKLVEIWARRKT
jgi:uncharacterized membrane protein YdbT with pleckstrin-like domain